ncbi:Endoplasmic reticulum chaperone BiP, partial [Gonapodya sp. JEL0774]
IELGTTYSTIGLRKDDQIHFLKVDHDAIGLEAVEGTYASCSAENQAKEVQLCGVNRTGGTALAEKYVKAHFAILKERAELFLNSEVKSAVVAIPCHFTDAQRQLIKTNGGSAGLWIERIVRRPIIAGIAHELHEITQIRDVLVLDFDREYCTSTVLNCDEGILTVVATNRVEYGGLSVQEMRVFVEGELRWSVEKTLQEAEVDPDTLRDVIVIGASSVISGVRDIVEVWYGKAKVRAEAEGKFDTDDAVAYGAFIQAQVLLTERFSVPSNICEAFLDLSLIGVGIETTGGVVEYIIPRNTRYPTRKVCVYSTATDNQSTAAIRIYEGERPRAEHCRLLCSLTVSDLPPAPRGVPRIEITFEMDKDYKFRVEAREVSTGREVSWESTQGLWVGWPADALTRVCDESRQFEQEDAEVISGWTGSGLLEAATKTDA